MSRRNPFLALYRTEIATPMNVETRSARARILIRKPPADVFAAFADADRMGRFWFTRRDGRLIEGRQSTWYLGSGEDAFSFEVMARTVSEPDRLAIDWTGPDGKLTTVEWTFEATGEGHTVLSIVESGFAGEDDEVAARVVDSTAGFNQVVVAAKALIEHGVAINVVDDHV